MCPNRKGYDNKITFHVTISNYLLYKITVKCVSYLIPWIPVVWAYTVCGGCWLTLGGTNKGHRFQVVHPCIVHSMLQQTSDYLIDNTILFMSHQLFLQCDPDHLLFCNTQ